jgi:hypothetical protein
MNVHESYSVYFLVRNMAALRMSVVRVTLSPLNIAT